MIFMTTENPPLLLASALPNGTDRKRVVSGIASMRDEHRGLPIGHARSVHASGAVSLFRRWFGGTGMNSDFAVSSISDAQFLRVNAVRPLQERSDVWCLTVDDPMHWWSLANGAVTHNSHGADAMKTVATGLPLVTALSSALSLGGRLRRKIRGLV